MLTINDRAVLTLDLLMPSSRAWVATGEVEGDEPLSGAVELSEGDEVVFRGTVLEAGDFGGRTGFRIVGGAGGLSTVVRAQSYRAATAALPIQDILGQAGEALTAPLESSLAASSLAEWATGAWEASRALDDLAEYLGVSWWVDALGGVSFGASRALAIPAELTVVAEDTQGRTLTVAPDTGSEWVLRPGATVDGRQVTSVRFRLSDGRLRIECRYESLGLAGLIEAIVERATRKMAYLAVYPSTVHSQASDGTLQVFPDDERIPKMAGVKLSLPVPGAEVRVRSGARVLLGFEGGDPAKPYATGWGSEGFESVAFGGGTRAFARVGDPVTIFASPGVPVPISGTVGGAPLVGAVVFTSPLLGVVGAGTPQVLG